MKSMAPAETNGTRPRSEAASGNHATPRFPNAPSQPEVSMTFPQWIRRVATSTATIQGNLTDKSDFKVAIRGLKGTWQPVSTE